MELQKIKPRRAVCFRSKQVIMGMLEKYDSLKGKISPVQFYKDHDVPVGTFYTWLRYRRAGKYKAEGRFIALSVEPVATPEHQDLFRFLPASQFRRVDRAAARVCELGLYALPV